MIPNFMSCPGLPFRELGRYDRANYQLYMLRDSLFLFLFL